MLEDFIYNFTHNLFKPLLLFFYMGFLIPILKVPFEYPHVLYKSISIYLLISIGWHGGEELAMLEAVDLQHALGFMIIGFITNTIIGTIAYFFLRYMTKLRQIDAATVAGYYGSDSAGTFVTCVGVLAATNIAFAAYMPVLLAVMEIPGCLVALFLVSRLRNSGQMDAYGNMPGEPEYDPSTRPSINAPTHSEHHMESHDGKTDTETTVPVYAKSVGAAAASDFQQSQPQSVFSKKVLHEVFFNPGLYLLFGGILIGFIGRLQGVKVTEVDDKFFVVLFHGVLSLFLLEMGMTACSRLKDLKNAGPGFIVFALLLPNVFAMIGILVTHGYSMVLGESFDVGTYALFAVLCGAASYIAVPAVQRLAIPEASPTLPLAASLGLTFTYNVTVGIPLYIMLATAVISAMPVN
ncbi:MAG: sodium-dependent bicarbonate transport family permease [Nitrospirales bacterium]|nr:MAG: sodium-dependent bicarbonate transport family permease [Nitrospirales bacterium]